MKRLLLLLLLLVAGCQSQPTAVYLDGRVIAVARTFENFRGIVIQTRSERVTVLIAARDYPAAKVVRP